MNKVILMGRLTKDAELNYTAGSGTAVTRFSLAVTRPFKKDETDFINCVAFGKIGETIAQYFTKGKPIAITGNIRTGSYEAKDGTKRYTTDVVIEGFEFIGGEKKEGDSNNSFKGELDKMSFGEEITPVYDEDTPF